MTKLLENSNIIIVLLVLVLSLIILSKGADKLVDNAVKLSKILGLPEIIIGATIVSLGTTLPELSASITSVLQGNGNFALGNAVGSIIANTSLIIGIGALYGKIPVDRKSSQKLSMLIAAVFLLILPTIPYKIAGNDGRIPQWMGIILVLLIPVYIIYLMNQDKNNNQTKDKIEKEIEEKELIEKSNKTLIPIIGKIFLAALFIALSAKGLVSSAEVMAERIGIPDIIIASTLVAFGTSVPELSTCITATKRKHGGLAIGNIMGANILNILMVVGASVSLTPGGIIVSQSFYRIHFIVLGLVLAIFGFFAYNKRLNEISKKEGIILITIYMIYLGANLYSAIG